MRIYVHTEMRRGASMAECSDGMPCGSKRQSRRPRTFVAAMPRRRVRPTASPSYHGGAVSSREAVGDIVAWIEAMDPQERRDRMVASAETMRGATTG